MDNEEQCAPATAESFSSARDAVEEPAGNTLLIGSQQPINHGLWDKFGFRRNKNYLLKIIVSEICSHCCFSITYNTSTENAFIDMNDDILTVCIDLFITKYNFISELNFL